jgi:hypothetical protein
VLFQLLFLGGTRAKDAVDRPDTTAQPRGAWGGRHEVMRATELMTRVHEGTLSDRRVSTVYSQLP